MIYYNNMGYFQGMRLLFTGNLISLFVLPMFLFVPVTMSAARQEQIQDSVHHSWTVVRENQQKSFSHTVPAGNYSGITHLHDDIYAVVSDKSDSALFFNFRMQINPSTGDLEKVENLGYVLYVDGTRKSPGVSHGVRERGFDHEAIAKVSDSMLVVSSEGKYRLKEYLLKGDAQLSDGENMLSDKASHARSLWEWKKPSSDFYPNYVYESLAFDSVHHCLWTISESTLRKDGEPATPQNPVANKLRLIGFEWNPESSLHPVKSELVYMMDKPSTDRAAQTYVMGVSELCALPDGQLLVLEREAFVPKAKIGAFCHCKLYVVDPIRCDSALLDRYASAVLPKKLLTKWRTSLTLFGRSFANYEGMCLGPRLKDGSQVIILLSDSQNQYAGVLKDWFKTIVVR